MNVPNAITLGRVVLALLMLPLLRFGGSWVRLGCLPLMAVVFLSDAFDGKLARKLGQVTDFGKLFDPLADKIAVIALLLALGEVHRMVPAWVIWVIFLRESAVTFLREVAYRSKIVVAARMVGKLKTVTQVTALHIVLALILVVEFQARLPWVSGMAAEQLVENLRWISLGVLLPAVALTIYSGVIYLHALRPVLREASRPDPLKRSGRDG